MLKRAMKIQYNKWKHKRTTESEESVTKLLDSQRCILLSPSSCWNSALCFQSLLPSGCVRLITYAIARQLHADIRFTHICLSIWLPHFFTHIAISFVPMLRMKNDIKSNSVGKVFLRKKRVKYGRKIYV